MCGAFRSSLARRPSRFFPGRFPSTTHGYRRTGNGSPTFRAGRPVVSVRAMSGQPKRVVVSGDGGSQPVWRRDGQELLYVDLEGRLRGRSVSRNQTGDLTLGVAKAVSVPLIGSGHWGTQYDVSRDGQYVVLHRPDAGAEAERHPSRDRVGARSSSRVIPNSSERRSPLRREDVMCDRRNPVENGGALTIAEFLSVAQEAATLSGKITANLNTSKKATKTRKHVPKWLSP